MAKGSVICFREQQFGNEVGPEKGAGMKEIKGKAGKGKGGGISTSNNKVVAGNDVKRDKFTSASGGMTKQASFGGRGK